MASFYAVPSDILIRNYAVISNSSRSLLIQSRSRQDVEIMISGPVVGSFFSVEELEGGALTGFTISDGKPLKLKVVFNAPEDNGSECVQGQ